MIPKVEADAKSMRALRRVSAIRKWLGAKSESCSLLCGEEFTRMEVLLANAGALLFIMIIGVAAWLEGGAL